MRDERSEGAKRHERRMIAKYGNTQGPKRHHSKKNSSPFRSSGTPQRTSMMFLGSLQGGGQALVNIGTLRSVGVVDGEGGGLLDVEVHG